MLDRREALRRAAADAGFTPDALVATERLLDQWQRFMASTMVFWPTNAASQRLLRRVAVPTDDGFLALGVIQPSDDGAATRRLAADWPRALQRDGVLLSGWKLVGTAVFELVVADLPRVVLPIFLLVVGTLWLSFRSVKAVVLSLLTLGLGGLCLEAAMELLHWRWNLLNLMALPLLLGLGVDYSIHIQLGMRRYQGDRLAVRRSVGRALLLAGATTIAGFASLAWSSNAGLASLGKVCALGIGLTLLTAVYLLPVWWQAIEKPRAPEA
jgi:predicted RND superfamily exporter protein